MPSIADKDEIRTILRREPAWAVYALGDLSPRMFDKCRWYTPDLTMILRDYGTTILFATGPGSVREALSDVTGTVHLQVRADALDEIARVASVTAERLMWRMAWNHGSLPAIELQVTRLVAGDVPALERLYADGESSGESPDFFYPSMVSDGIFFGVYEDEALAAVAGTHLVAPEEGAVAIGNVYTRRDRRGRGLGRAVTAAVLRELNGIETVGLNVRADNDAAIRIYESLGFVRHCPFFEAVAVRRGGSSDPPARRDFRLR
jgi:ribosomal protein S18 acetylase RimI-like enzyme